MNKDNETKRRRKEGKQEDGEIWKEKQGTAGHSFTPSSISEQEQGTPS